MRAGGGRSNAITSDDVLLKIREFMAQHKNRKSAAAALGVSCTYLSDVLSGARAPSRKILHVLGLEPVKVYQAIANPKI